MAFGDTATARLSSLSRAQAFFVTLLCGVGIGLGQAPFNLPFLTFICFPVLFLQLGQTTGRWQAFRLGWLAGTAQFSLVLSWIVEPFLVDIARHGWMAPFALVFMSAGLALFWAAAFAAARSIEKDIARLLVLAVCLVGLEWMRGWVLTGFPWAMIAYIWAEYPVLQAAAFIGPHGLSLITVLLALAPGIGKRGILVAVLGVALLWTGGEMRLAQPLEPRAEPLLVRIIQPNAAQHLKWQPEMLRTFYDRLISLSESEADQTPDVVIWPETAAAFLLGERQDLLEDMASAAKAPVIFGIRRTEGWGKWYNSAAVIDTDGALVASHDKDHLVPFGEYVPFNDFFANLGIAGLSAGNSGGFSAGQDSRYLKLENLPDLLILICYEAIFPSEFATTLRPEWMVLVTNDAWFGNWTGPYQHLAQGQFRAIENGLPMARAANTGVSAMIDPYGRVLESLPLGVDGKLDVLLPATLPATFFVRFGNLIFFTMCAFCISIALIAARSKR